MSRLLILTTRELAVGYRLAGAAALEVTSTDEAQVRLAELLAVEDGVIAVHAPYFYALPRPFLRQLDSLRTPLVVALPSGMVVEHRQDRRQRLLEVLRQAVGYQITFGEDRTTK